ncbi:MAG: TIGR04211 family SH3 domain-containing protein [Oleiphilus sp.]
MNTFKRTVFSYLCLLLPLFSVSALAETMYIDDTLLVPIRSGESTSYRIVHKGIPSGTKLEIIEHNKESGYSKVVTPGGIEGYLPTRYLTSEPIAKVKLSQTNQTLNKLKQEHEQLEASYNKLKSEHQSLSQLYKETEQSLDKNVQELSHIRSVSGNALNLDKRNQELRENNEQLRNELELVQADNTRLKDKAESNMMLVGGGLVLFGVILALLIPMLKPSKKNDSWA